MSVTIQGGNALGYLTQSANTKIRRLIPSKVGFTTRLFQMQYRTGGTQHTATILRSLGRTTITTAALISQPNVILQADPGPAGNGIATSDLVAIRSTVDGLTRLYAVNTWTSGSRTLALTTNLLAAATVGDVLWMFGVETSTDPLTNLPHQTYGLWADNNPQTTTYADFEIGINASNNVDEPLLVSIDNVTNQGYLLLTTHANTVP